MLHSLYHEQNEVAYVHISNKDIPVYFEENEEETENKKYPLRPLWQDIALLCSQTHRSTLKEDIFLQPEETTLPSLTTFFSFKGGVGRTLHLTAMAYYLAKKVTSTFDKPNILLVDADTEASGLTWWAEDTISHTYSYLDFLDALLEDENTAVHWALNN